MKILLTASEAVPYVKTGGLADVIGAVFKEYKKAGAEAYLILPLYRAIKKDLALADTGLSADIRIGNRSVTGRVFSHGSSVYFLECDEFFDRDYLYGTPRGDYPDNAARFSFFSRGVLEACRLLSLKPDVIHCNDWQTALIPLYLKSLYRNDFFKDTASLITIHNLGYQGLFDKPNLPLTGIGEEWFNPDGIEFFGRLNFLKAGIVASDIITTVSGNYAREILTEELGFGLNGSLKKRSDDLYGVINGIDTEEWDPLSDRFTEAGYSMSDMSGKAICRKGLSRECFPSVADDGSPLVSFVGRLASQKGIDILVEAADDILAAGARLVVLGSGDELFQDKLSSLSIGRKERMFVMLRHDEGFAHRIYAGSDIFLMPSRYEPCGLGQLISMRYGTVPVARMTGGLADTITDWDARTGSGTGFLFKAYSAASFLQCVKRALGVYKDKEKWGRIVAQAMAMDFSWRKSAGTYIELYEKAIRKRRGVRDEH